MSHQEKSRKFLSTLSLRRATTIFCTERFCRFKFLSTLSLRRATREPTALRTPHHKFLSTLSLRRATNQQPAGTTRTTYFYPRSPCGERRMKIDMANSTGGFLSTLSLRRATARRDSRQQPAGISIHALLAESDRTQSASLSA